MTGSLGTGHFDRLWNDEDDPWGLESSWYEDRKRAAGEQTLPVRLGDELPVNPFLLAPDAETFGRLREAKNSFKG